MVRMIDDSIKRQLSKRMDFFLKYFPVRVRNVGEDAVAARQLIWAFKDARDNAFEKVAQMTAAHLIKVCGEKIKDIDQTLRKNSRYRTIFMIIYLIRAFCGTNFMSVTEDYLTAPADFPQQKYSMIYVSF